jgi:hypothetical protein
MESLTKDELKEGWDDYMELCRILHENADLISKVLMEKIEDKLYGHYEP